MFSDSDLVVATQRHVACDIGEESVILQLDDGIYYGLNRVGARVWQLIQKPCSLEDIVRQITTEFEVERGRCSAEVAALLVELQQRKLVEVTSGKQPAL